MMKTFREGFTLVELSLSMVFIGILSVAIVLIISNTISSYQRGLTLNQVNTTGMAIVDDMRTAVQNSSSKSVENNCYRYYQNNTSARQACISDDGLGFVTHTRVVDDMKLDYESEAHSAAIYGVFCTGDYSYIWNSGYFMTDYAKFGQKNGGNWATLTYTVQGGKQITIVGSLSGYYDENGRLKTNEDGTVGNPEVPFRLLKVPDKERAICGSLVRNEENGFGYEQPSSATLTNNFIVDTGDGGYTPFPTDVEPVDLLLADGDNDLAIYDLYVAKPAESVTRKNSFYSASFILGTMRGGANIFAQGKNCQVPSDYKTEEFNYCAINKFSFAVQAGGE